MNEVRPVWKFDGYVAKAKLYFSRAEPDENSPNVFPADRILWLLLGLEFLLRAPLARINPTLLAIPEGKSILHAAGFARPGMNPRSVPTKTVVDRLLHIEPEFGEDRGKDALFLAELRNSELHTADATLEGLRDEAWLPKFIDIVEAVCSHLSLEVGDFLDDDLVQHARAVRDKSDRALQGGVLKALKEAGLFFARLTVEEVAARIATRDSRISADSMRNYRLVSCPACSTERAATLRLSFGRVGRSSYDEDTGQISYTTTFLAEEITCCVCNLHLDGTASVIAAGVDRLYVEKHEEDRYQGWEGVVSYAEALDFIGDAEPDYGND